MNKSNLAIIPARGGSKRVPNKNIRDFHGKPILACTIEAAVQSGLFSKIIVSTDSNEIASVAKRYGAEIPFLRESSLSDDYTPISLVTADALERLDPNGLEFKSVAQLMPNCPMRTDVDIINSFKQFTETDTDSQISIMRYGWLNPWWAMKRNDAYEIEPIFHEQMNKRSQDLPELFCPTGAIWWAKTDVLRREKTFHIEGRTGWEMPWQRAIDIDTEEDWQMAEFLMSMQMDGFEK